MSQTIPLKTLVIDQSLKTDKVSGNTSTIPPQIQAVQTNHVPQQQTSSHHVQINIITALTVIAFVIIGAVVLKKYFWKRKITLRHIPSTETIATKFEFVE